MLALNIEKIDAVIEPILRVARIPGAAIAIVVGDEMVLAKGYGLRDVQAGLPMTTDSLYPIASTTKSMTATLLGMLVDEARLGWDVPIQNYLPGFRLGDPMVSAQVTVRDLLLMRTGLARHDWMWGHRAITRAELVERLRYLELSSGFRERFQYNNLTVMAAAHIAEVVSGQSWEALTQERLLEPLGMCNSRFALSSDKATCSYHESVKRELQLTQPLLSQATAPSGGALCSTVEDMARWMAFNLSGGKAQERQLIQPQTLAEICAPQLVIGPNESPPAPGAMRAMGWTVDRYNGHVRVSHSGLLLDVRSDVTLYPQLKVGLVSFVNFAFPLRAKLINQYAFDQLIGSTPPIQTWEADLAQYEKNIEDVRSRHASVRRVTGTSPSHALSDYAGRYTHPGYGEIEIRERGGELTFGLNDLTLTLEHWHYDAWIAKDVDWFAIHISHEFDRTNRLLFETDADGEIAAVSMRLEPAVAAIRFKKIF